MNTPSQVRTSPQKQILTLLSTVLSRSLATLRRCLLTQGSSVSGWSSRTATLQGPTRAILREGTPEVAMISPGYTILVVEDSDVVRHLAHRILVRRGYWVLEAADANEALRLLTSGVQIDLVLLDVVLPGRGGVELYAAISAQRPNLPVLFMSAYPAEILATEGLPDLTLPFLAKPFTPDTLLAKVRATIEARRAARGRAARADLLDSR